MRSVVAYTLSSYEHALSVLRVAGPLHTAGLELTWGNKYADISPEKVLQADVVVITRDFPRYTTAYHKILYLARANGKPVLLDMDDLLLELPEDHPDRLSDYYAGALLPMLLAVLEVDGLTASTKPLCEYLQTLNPNVWLLPNYYNDQVWRMLPPKSPTEAHHPLVIGYMGGDSHKPDLEMIQPLLQRLLKNYPDELELKFLGVKPPGELVDHPRVLWAPLSLPDYPKFADLFLQQDWDICIAPLKNNLFNQCKSPVKFFEYTALGVPGVYSRIAPFEEIILQGESGFLATSLEEWETYLTQLIESPVLRHAMARRAQETILKDWSLSNHAHQWAAAYRQCAALTTHSLLEKPPAVQTMLRVLAQVQEWQDKLQTELGEKTQSEEDTLRQVALREQTAAQLQEKELTILGLKAELDNIYSSNGWAYLQKALHLRRRLIPEGSRREQIFQGLLNRLK